MSPSLRNLEAKGRARKGIKEGKRDHNITYNLAFLVRKLHSVFEVKEVKANVRENIVESRIRLMSKRKTEQDEGCEQELYAQRK